MPQYPFYCSIYEQDNQGKRGAVKKCEDCECVTVCARWVAGNATAEPAEPDACGAFLAAIVGDRESDPYFNDRPYPIESEWANGANPYARENPDAPWVWRGLPTRASAGGALEFVGHELTSHTFPIPDVAPTARQRRFESLIGIRPERVA